MGDGQEEDPREDLEELGLAFHGAVRNQDGSGINPNVPGAMNSTEHAVGQEVERVGLHVAPVFGISSASPPGPDPDNESLGTEAEDAPPPRAGPVLQVDEGESPDLDEPLELDVDADKPTLDKKKEDPEETPMFFGYKTHFVERDSSRVTEEYAKSFMKEPTTSQQTMKFDDFMEIRKRQVDDFAKIKREFRQAEKGCLQAIEAITNSKDGDEQKALMQDAVSKGLLLKEEANEIKRISDKQKAEGDSATSHDNYYKELAKEVAKRKAYEEGSKQYLDERTNLPGKVLNLLDKGASKVENFCHQGSYYGVYKQIKPFLLENFKNDDRRITNYREHQITALMELYDGVEMTFDTPKGEAKNFNSFCIKYQDPESPESEAIKLVEGTRIPSEKADKGHGGTIEFKANLSSKDPKVWEKALCLMVDQRKRLMNRTWGLKDNSFPITGNAHPEKIMKLYHLALMQNLDPTLGEKQIKKLQAHDAANGTNYMGQYRDMMIIKGSVWPDSINEEGALLGGQLENDIHLAAAQKKNDRGGERISETRHGKGHWEHHNLVEELQALSLEKDMDKREDRAEAEAEARQELDVDGKKEGPSADKDEDEPQESSAPSRLRT